VSAFKVGDRVVVVSSAYERCEDQPPNLGVGNTGVISEVLAHDVFLVVMDKGPRRTPYVGGGLVGGGWAFYGRELRHENERGEP
jgi:hypothetical protein